MMPDGTRPKRVAPAIRSVTAGLRGEEGRFRLALCLALTVHVLAVASLYSAPARQLGDPSGVEGAIAIDLASLSDINGTATVSDRGGEAMPPSPEAAIPAPPIEIPPLLPQPAQAEPSEPKPAAQRTEQKAPELAKSPPAPENVERKSEQSQKAAPKGDEAALRDSLADKGAQPQKKAPTQQKSEAKQPDQKPAQPQQKQASLAAPRLDLNLPASAFERPTFTSGGAGLERPAGITRSGENDDFARGVIRALQRTMPQLTNTRGQVTVRITLDGRGNIVGTVVTKPSGVAGLDQNVVFATKQTSYPIPPRNHVAADLVFLITYIYR